MFNPLVSVVIPTYNRAFCIRDAIDSVLAQSFRDYELIVVDDGSTDKTSEIVGGYRDLVKLIRQANTGASAARNAGIRIAQGEWIAFLDSDDTWEPEKLKLQIEDLRANPRAIAHMVDARICDVQSPYRSLFELRGLRDEFRRKPFRQYPLCDVISAQFFTPCWMLKRRAIEAAGFFDHKLKIFEEFDLLVRVALEGPFFVNCFIGTNVRRISGDRFALSALYQHSRLQSLQNLTHTYSRLKRDPRLTQAERRLVGRFLSGAHFEVAVQHRQKHQWRAAVSALFRSVADKPGLRSVARAFLAVTGTKEFITRLLPRYRKRHGFRRSEMNDISLS